MVIFDIVLAVILIIAFVKGLKDGLFVEAASLIALVAGIYGAIHFSHIVGDYLKPRVSWEERYISLAAFAATFIIIVLGISLVGRLLTKIADFAMLGWINKIAGGLFGALKWGLIVSVVLLIFDRFNNKITFVTEQDKSKSILYEPIKNLAPMLFPNIIKGSTETNQTEKTT